MTTVYREENNMTDLTTYMAANDGIVIDYRVFDRTHNKMPNALRHVIAAEIWQPPTNTVVAAKGARTLSIAAHTNVGTVALPWWTAGTDDVALVVTTPAHVRAITNAFKGDERQFHIGGGTGESLQFHSALIHIHGTIALAGAESIELFGITEAGGLVSLGTGAVTNPGGVTTLNETLADDITNFVGIQFATSGIVAATALSVDIILTAAPLT